MSAEARWIIRDGERGGGEMGAGRGGEGRVSGSSAHSDPQKTKEAVDCRQNSKYVKAVGTSPVRSNLCAPLIAVSTAVRGSHKMMVMMS